MSIDKLKSVAEEIAARVSVVRGKGEEATKQALVLPMLNALGFDIWNPTEVCPEYEADFSIKKQGQKEKVDFAVLIDNTPRIYIEVKAVDVSLDGHEGQIARYFNATPSVSLAALTNGVEYRFYTDTKEMNIMDDCPFHIARLDAVDQGIDVLAKFHKNMFTPDAIRDFATQIQYTTKIASFIRKQIDLCDADPSDSFVSWILNEEGSYSGKIYAKTIERFQSIIKDSLQIVLRDIVRRSVAALDREVRSPSSQPQEQEFVSDIKEESNDAESELSTSWKKMRTITTEDELALFADVKSYFDSSEFSKMEIFDKDLNKLVKAEISYADNPIYFSIYITKPSMWIIRAAVESKKPWIGFNILPDEGDKIIPAGYVKMVPYAHSKFRISFDKNKMAKPLSALINLAIQKILKESEMTR